MAEISYLVIFESFISAIIMTFFPNATTYRTNALIFAIIIALVLARYIVKKRFIINYKTFKAFIVGVIILVLYNLTPVLLYSGTDPSSSYYTLQLSMAGQVFPAVVVAAFVAFDEPAQEKIKKLSPLVGTIFSTIAIVSSFFPTSVTTGGYVDNSNNLNYQSVSYMAAIAAALLEYYLIFCNKRDWLSIFNHKFGKILAAILVILDGLSILIAGGRGGFVTYFVFLACFVILYIRLNSIDRNTLLKYALYSVVIVVVGFILLRFAYSYSGATSGFDRILSFIQEGDSNGRDVIREQALSIFAQSPIIGHGVGSVFFEMAVYSHNLFLDCLLETGVIGALILVAVLFVTFKKQLRLLKAEPDNYIWLIIFLNGFVMSMFSGYYLGHADLYWAVTYLLIYPKSKSITRSNKDI